MPATLRSVRGVLCGDDGADHTNQRSLIVDPEPRAYMITHRVGSVAEFFEIDKARDVDQLVPAVRD